MNNYLKIMVIATLPLLYASCSSDEDIAEEAVEVIFSAALPQMVQTRASSTTLNVNKVVCATFENGTEIQSLRQTIDIVDGQDIVYSPRLVKGRKYQVAFWAMKDGAYNVDDMKSISPVAESTGSYTGDPERYECFTNCTDEFTVAGSVQVSITLTRPMGRVKFGVSDDDMQAVTALGYIPTKVEVTVQSPETYNALGKSCSATTQLQTMTLPMTNGSLSVNNVVYTDIASYMVFTDGGNVSLTYTIYGKKSVNGPDEQIVSQTIDNVPLGVNKNTNIVGDLMTGAIKYTITMNSAYGDAGNQTL